MPSLLMHFIYLKQVRVPVHNQDEGIMKSCEYQKVKIMGPLLDVCLPHSRKENLVHYKASF